MHESSPPSSRRLGRGDGAGLPAEVRRLAGSCTPGADRRAGHPPPFAARRALLAGFGALVATAGALPARPALAAAPADAPLEEVPYVKTPSNVVDAILELAEVGPADRLIDLGSGDGRIVIEAARRFGARGLGVELDPSLVALSNERAREAGVADRARFVQQDLFDTDLAPATVITMYLLPDVNLALRPRLLERLAPGTRVVSHDWNMGDWRPERSVTVAAPDKPVGLERRSTVHLWIVPARVGGRWDARVGDARRFRPLELAFEQRYQDVTVSVASDGRAPRAGRGTLRGDALRFEVQAGRDTMRFEGRVAGAVIEGSVERDGQRTPWRATRR